jgi:DNA mismatch repair protein MSH6
VIMDELGRGTSTFDGTAIASAAVKHLVDRSRCLSLFATHYHSLLDDWKDTANVRLGHMECLVENGNVTSRSNEQDESTITFLYTLGEGVCPKSFGINVARLAGLPEDVLSNAKRISCEFEQEMNNDGTASRVVTARSAPSQKSQIADAIRSGNMADIARLWESLQA